MRFTEFQTLVEDDFDDMIEDDADTRGDANLITALEFLRNRAGNNHLVPKVRADALINMVQNTGHPEFNFAALDAAYKSNDTVKNLIKSIDDDDRGTKYVFLNSVDPAVDTSGGEGEEGGPELTQPEKTVSSMASRALGKRS
jgi:hypothetical protein